MKNQDQNKSRPDEKRSTKSDKKKNSKDEEEKEEEEEEEEGEEEESEESEESDSVSSASDRSPTNIHRNVRTTERVPYSCPEWVFLVLTWILFVITAPISICMCLTVLNEFERAVILRMGRLRPGGARGPGVVFVLPCIDEYVKVDLRTVSLDVPPQDILTKDSVTVNVDAVVYYRINNPLDVILQVMDPKTCCRLLCMTTLRNITGSYMLIDLISSKKALSRQIKSVIDSSGATEPWGIRIERVNITDIVMPESLQRAMAVEQEARRDAMAKVAAANGERDAVKALKQAADVMESNPIALQLRYLQTISTICNEETQSIVFPFPIDIVEKMIGK